ncbi:carbonic anhydrase family protein [Streptomyces europaeiscabiei]|uniref:carbonic anhydrase n=1 Tax=Streptomyces europaeiscabiei TaxID=146819 RepID=A0AAJ2PJA9_9ACTN|nr:carbonic anhydrase family protein [Streptomyces europaeiscabiei]MDX3128273.1 carbonic anhydrase family protein [Streptomyces europaeiscabiei]
MSQTAPAPAPSVVRSPLLRQSPVDIRPQDTDSSALPPLRFHHPTGLDLRLHFDDPDRHTPESGPHGSGRADCVRDDEGTVKAEPPPGEECLLRVGPDRYELVDVHWHTPSEHTVGGVVFPMEQHMKYRRVTEDVGPARAGGSGYTVIGVFVHPGQANDPLDRLLTSARRDEEPWEVLDVELDALLPPCTESYRYVGSTTVCPYTPGVRWNLLTHPVQASPTALAHYRKLFPKGNARAVQPIGDRRIAGDRHRCW